MKLGEMLHLTGLYKIYVIDYEDLGDVLFAGLTIATPPEMREYQVEAVGAHDSALTVWVGVPER